MRNRKSDPREVFLFQFSVLLAGAFFFVLYAQPVQAAVVNTATVSFPFEFQCGEWARCVHWMLFGSVTVLGSLWIRGSARSTSSKQENQVQAIHRNRATFPNTRALIVDHHLPTRKQLRQLLESLDVEVEEVGNGSRAADRALNTRFDVILMSPQLPILRAAVVRKVLRQSGVATPIVLTCATGDEAELEQFADVADAVATLVHPIDRLAIQSVLSDLLPGKVVDSSSVHVIQSVEAMQAALESDDLGELAALAQQLRDLGESIGSSALVESIGRLESYLDDEEAGVEEVLRRQIESNIAEIATAAQSPHRTVLSRPSVK